jgi:hypothetical protein
MFGVLTLGPSKLIVCGAGSGLDAIADDVGQRFGGGHIDGSSASYCSVPAASAWVMATVAFAGTLAVVLAVVARRSRRSTAS